MSQRSFLKQKLHIFFPERNDAQLEISLIPKLLYQEMLCFKTNLNGQSGNMFILLPLIKLASGTVSCAQSFDEPLIILTERFNSGMVRYGNRPKL